MSLGTVLLKKDPSTIREVEVTNPIILGESIDEKEIHLDVRTVVDNEREMVFEMQLINHDGWRERTLIYACRAYDKLDHGDDYRNARGVWQISFCNFTLFPDEPEFYSTYMFINQKKPSQIYSDKIKISCVDLKSIHLATDDDRSSGIDLWAKLFNTRTWEELKAMADENKLIDKAVSSAWQLSEDAEIRDQMRRREENERLWNSRENLVKSLQAELEEKNNEIDLLKAQIEDLKKAFSVTGDGSF